MNLRPKRLLPGSKPRAKVTRTLAELENLSHGVSGANPHCLVYVRTYCAKLRKDWRQAVLNNSAHVVETIGLGDEDEYGHHRITVYRVVGTVKSLTSVVMHRCVMRYEYVTNSRVPLGEKLDEGGIPYVLKVTAQGAGEPKPIPPRKTHMTTADQEYHRGHTLGHGIEGDCYATEEYADKRGKTNKPTGSATEVESHTESIKASNHTTLPSHMRRPKEWMNCELGGGI